MTSTQAKRQRVREELLAAGMTLYGLTKSESKALPDHIGDNEHILAVIYGQYEATSAMMVATNLRLLFIDIRAMHNIVEDTSYDSFGDLSIDEGIMYSKVTLRTKPKEYTFHMVNRVCARRFLNVVEEKTLRRMMSPQHKDAKHEPLYAPVSALPDEVDFLQRHYVATLSTRGPEGYPYGATMFYFYDREDPDVFYIVTKSSTSSAANMRKHPKVALTVTDFDAMATMHVLGEAERVKNAAKSQRLVALLFEKGSKLSKAEAPPVTQIKDGSFVVYRVHMHKLSLKYYL